MIKAGFVSSSPNWHWERQFPDSVPVWDDVEFVFSGDFAECDIVFVFDAVPDELSGRLTARRSLFIASEPASVKTYRHDFLAQFDCVLTTDRSTRHPNVIFGQPGLPWHVGAWDSVGQLSNRPMTFNDFETFKPTKTKSISVVASNKAFTDGHRARLAFVERLKAYFGDEIDVFGRKINGFGDKTEVLSAYRYHIAIENSSFYDYWTEKLSDAFLTLTYPIYFGCPNIVDYFDSNAVAQIDIADDAKAISAIKRLLESDKAESAMPYLREARQKVLREHNLFAILCGLATHSLADDRNLRLILSENHFRQQKSKLTMKLGKRFESLRRRLFGDY